MENKVILTAFILVSVLAVSCVSLDTSTIQCHQCSGVECATTSDKVITCLKADGCATVFGSSN